MTQPNHKDRQADICKVEIVRQEKIICRKAKLIFSFKTDSELKKSPEFLGMPQSILQGTVKPQNRYLGIYKYETTW